MKNLLYFFSLVVLFSMASCSNEDDLFVDRTGGSTALMSLKSVSDPAIGTTTTLNLTDDLLEDGITTTGGLYWEDTYTANTNIVSDIFTFSHSAMSSMGYNYWDGFIVSNVNDTTNYGAPGSSDDWVAHQWGCMPGSGVNTAGSVTPGTPGTPGDPFIVAYWSSYMDPENPGGGTFSESVYSNWVKIGNTGVYRVLGLSIANHPWPYYGNLYGDGFAIPLDQPGDYFDLYIYGVDSNNKISDTPVTVSLAKNETGNDLVQSADWITLSSLDLNDLGNVKYLIFQMASSDSDPTYGMNTAAYFCLDKLQVLRIQ